MNRYLALVFYVLGVNCAQVDDPAIAFFEYVNTAGSLYPPDADIEKIIKSLNAIPESSYQKADQFMKTIRSDLESYPAKNSVRQHVENAATVMAFFERARFEPSTEETATMKEKMKQLGPQFTESLAKVGLLSDPLTASSPSRDSKIKRLKIKHIDSVLKSIRKIDSSIIEKLKSFCKDMVEELKESGVKIDNVVFRHLSKVRTMIDVFEATGFKRPDDEFLDANPWIDLAFETIAPVFLQEMVYLTEFANLIQTTELAAAESKA